MSNETRPTEAEMTRSYFDASDARTKRMIVECDHEEAQEMDAEPQPHGPMCPSRVPFGECLCR